jgi:hypothetical protein
MERPENMGRMSPTGRQWNQAQTGLGGTTTPTIDLTERAESAGGSREAAVPGLPIPPERLGEPPTSGRFAAPTGDASAQPPRGAGNRGGLQGSSNA